MAKRRRPNYRLVKIHYSYSVEEIARLFGIHRNTVREWLRRGLPAIDSRRPLLVQGNALAHFLRIRRQAAKRPCQPGQLYCVKCREPRVPAGGLIEFKPLIEPSGNLTAICPQCDALMYRRTSRDRVADFEAALALLMPQEQPHISQCGKPSLNCDFPSPSPAHANSQPAE